MINFFVSLYGDPLTWSDPFKASYISYLNLQDQITLAIEQQDEGQLQEMEQAGKKILEQVCALTLPPPTSMAFRGLSLDTICELQDLIQQAQQKNEKNAESLRGWIKGARPSHLDRMVSTESTYSSLSRLHNNRLGSLTSVRGGISNRPSQISGGQEKTETLGERVNHQS